MGLASAPTLVRAFWRFPQRGSQQICYSPAARFLGNKTQGYWAFYRERILIAPVVSYGTAVAHSQFGIRNAECRDPRVEILCKLQPFQRRLMTSKLSPSVKATQRIVVPLLNRITPRGVGYATRIFD